MPTHFKLAKIKNEDKIRKKEKLRHRQHSSRRQSWTVSHTPHK